MLNIYITNLGKYNEGELIGEWLTLPATEEELEVVLNSIGISDKPDKDGNYYEEYFITDYESDLNIEVGEYDNINELNDMAQQIEDMDEYDKEIITALMSNGDTFEEAIEHKDDCIIYYGCEDMEDVARQYADETGLLDSIPEDLRFYFDFKTFGRDMGFEGTFIFTDNGNCVQVY